MPMSLDETKTAQLADPTVKKLQNEAPHQLGKACDNAGDKRCPHEAWTLLDPKTNES